jgi:EAL domain-containing protein (putative c-di-GMP-specific phosphodiesterase class I)
MRGGEGVGGGGGQGLARLETLGYPGLRMAVNISPRQLEEPGFVDRVASIVRATGVAPGALELELTESLFLSPAAENEGVLEQLADLGVRLAVDDFGTGYSALAYLKRFPVHCLKIDKSFIHGVGHCNEDGAIVNAICNMAAHLGLDVIAEGVETRVQVDYLRRHPSVQAQGFYYARPLPLAMLLQRIKRERKAIRLAS